MTEDYLALQEWQVAGIKKALKSLDEGKAIPHADIVLWIESWGSEVELAKPRSQRGRLGEQ